MPRQPVAASGTDRRVALADPLGVTPPFRNRGSAAPAELLATLIPPAPSQEPEGAAADGATSDGRSSEEG